MATPTFPPPLGPPPLPSSSPVTPLSDSTPFLLVPTEYLSRNPESPHHLNPLTVPHQIPIIDLSHLTDQTPAQQRTQTTHNLAAALQDWGFFMVVNHGVPERAMAAVLEMCRGFFELGEEEKREYAGRGVMDPIRYGTSFNPAAEDVRYWRDYLKLIVHPNFNCPLNPQGLRDAVLEFSKSIREMVKVLLRGASESLELEQCYMEKTMHLDSGLQIFTANFYPPCPQPELALGMPPHSDHGFLTVLLQNGVEGLQVKHDGRWVDVRPPPNSLLINLGDHMEILSNGKYKSVVHRAVLNDRATRMSIAVVQGPPHETVVTPAPEFVKRSGQPLAFRGVKYGEFLKYQQSNQLREKSVLELLRLKRSHDLS